MTDCIVSARHILFSQQQLLRQGVSLTLEQLEATEPELAEYVFETLSRFYSQLSLLPIPARRTQKLYREIQSLLLTVILALQQAQKELWKEVMPASTPDTANPSKPFSLNNPEGGDYSI